MTTPDAFSGAEREAMRAAGIAVFEGRIIVDAQPPIDDSTLAKVAALCAGPLPDELVALWRTAFGGALDYDLRVDFGGHEAAFSFSEIFYPGSDGDQDLWGWVDHEQTRAAEADDRRHEAGAPKLEILPFGGFEYLERLYAFVAPGPKHGAIYAWTKGLPSSYAFYRHEDSLARAADGVGALFRRLFLKHAPSLGDDRSHGQRTLEHLGQLGACGEAGRGAAEKLRRLLDAAVLDWQGALADGTIATQSLARRVALEHAARGDDEGLLRRLEALGCDLAEPARAGANALDHALSVGSLRAASYLLERGVPAAGALRYGAEKVTPGLARDLIARGAVVDENAVLAAATDGDFEAALVMLDALDGRQTRAAVAALAFERARDGEQTAARLDAGTFFSNLSADQYRERARRLRALANRASPA